MAVTAIAQRVSAHQAAGSGFTTGAFTAGTTGNFLVAVLAFAASAANTIQDPTDNGSGSAWQRDVNFNPSNGVHNGILVASTIIGGTPPTTATFAWTGTSATAVKIFEFAGVASSAWLDVAGTPAAQSAGTAASASTITPAV